MFLNRNTVNTRLFGACNTEKIKQRLSHYAEGRPIKTTGGLFAWKVQKEEENFQKIIAENRS